MLTRALSPFGKVEKYEHRDGIITRHKGRFSSDKISLSKIHAWSVYYEMGMDVVRIEFTNDEEVRWIDKYNDLLGILRKFVLGKETVFKQ